MESTYGACDPGTGFASHPNFRKLPPNGALRINRSVQGKVVGEPAPSGTLNRRGFSNLLLDQPSGSMSLNFRYICGKTPRVLISMWLRRDIGVNR